VSKLITLAWRETEKIMTGFACWFSWQISQKVLINYLNLKLQDKNQNTAQLISHIDSSRRKLSVPKDNMNKWSQSLQSLHCHLWRAWECWFYSLCVLHRGTWKKVFKGLWQHEKQHPRFLVIHMARKLKNKIMICKWSCVNFGVGDFFLASKSNLQYEEFWKLLTNEQFSKLCKYGLKVCSIFGSTYICDCNFSTMKVLKTMQRNRLSENVLL
jgi:hypothetical protein